MNRENTRFFATGKKGKINRVFETPEETVASFNPRPVFELDMEASTRSPHFVCRNGCFENGIAELQFVFEIAQEYYGKQAWGDYGDVIQISRYAILGSTFLYTFDYVVRREFQRPGLAADLVPFVLDAEGNLFLVAIKRKNNPGKGRLALVGGFINVDGYEMETAAQTATREGAEEIKIQIYPTREDYDLFNLPNKDNLSVHVVFENNFRTRTHLYLVDTFFTSNIERKKNPDIKRVYQTTAYTLLIGVDEISRPVIGAKEIANLFAEETEEAEVVVLPLEKAILAKFAFGHHKEILEAAIEIIERKN
jgi:ADP-ribose pyrophosphatase YjhB (NUDIX family)